MFYNQPIFFQEPSFNGFVPPTQTNNVIVRNGNGDLVVLENEKFLKPESFDEDLQELRQRIKNHNWYYHLQKDLNVYNAGYHNERAILNIVQRRGGIFSTIWETERRRHLSNV